MAGHLADKGRKILLNGYNVIPIAPGGKFPTIKKWQNIKTTPELIGRWLRNGHAKDGIGITTGEVSFVDLDTPDPDAAQFMRDWVETNIGFAPIRVGNAPKHGLLFRSPNPFRKIASKTYVDDRGHDTRVEILGIGQQFVSHHIHPDTHRPYRWTAGDNPEHTRVEDLPPITEEQARSICDELDAYAASRGWKVKSGLTATNSLAVTDHSKALAGLQNEPEWNKVISALRSFPVDSRDDREKWYRVGMILNHAYGGSERAYTLWCRWSEKSAKYDPADQQRVWESFGRRNGELLRIGSLFYMAEEENGWKWTDPKESSSLKETDRPPLAYFDGDAVELDRTDDDLIDGVLSRNSLAMVYGDSTVGKTFFMLRVAYCLGSKTEFFGRLTTRKGAVLYVAAESGERLRNRVIAIRDGFPIKRIPVRVITSKINLYADTVDLERIIDAVKAAEQHFGMPVIAIIIDTLARAAPGMNENTSEDMGLAIGRLDRLREETGAAVVLVHHSGKDQTKGARGWSGLHAAVDHEIEITRDGDIRYANLGSKQRDGPDGNMVTFSLRVVELFERDDGRVSTTCVVEELNSDAPPPKNTKKKRIPAQKQAALDILNDLLANGEVDRDRWCEACSASPKVCGSANRKTRWSAFDRAYEYLARENLVFLNGDKIERHPEPEL